MTFPSHAATYPVRCLTVAVTTAVLLVTVGACGSDSPGDLLDPGAEDGVCDAASLVGSFEVTLGALATSVQGKVVDAVDPNQIPDVVETSGACQLLKPPTLFCDPSCTAGTTCNSAGMCVARGNGISVGTVTIAGLEDPVEMTTAMPTYFYTNVAPLAHPGFIDGAKVIMTTSGTDVLPPFALGATGFATLATASTSVALDRDVPVSVQWTAPADSIAATIHIDLNIAQHGGTPGRIECEVADTGQFELPVSLTNRLLDSGFSGYPSLVLTRRSADNTDDADNTDIAVGCVQLVLRSQASLEVDIDGLESCSFPEDCTAPETCLPDLTCG